MSRPARAVVLGALALFTAWSIAGMQICAAVLGVLVLYSGDFRRPVPVRGVVLAFGAWCVATVLLASPPWSSFEATAWRPVVVVWLVAATAAALTEQDLERTAAIWLGATAVASAWAVIQSFTGLDLLFLLHLRREPVVVPLDWPGHVAATGLFNSRLTYAHALLVPLGLAGAFALRGSRAVRAVALGAAALLGLGLVLSFARAAWWGALVAAAVLLVATRSRLLPLLAAAALGAALLVPSVRGRMASGLSTSHNEDRFFIWARAREVIADHPVLGVGFGAYPQVAGPYYDRADPAFPMHTWCHDTPLSLAAETGPLGLGLYLWLWLAIYRVGWSAVRSGSRTALGLLAGTLGLHTASLFHDVLYDGEVAFALYLGGGLLVGLGMLSKPAPAPPS